MTFNPSLQHMVAGAVWFTHTPSSTHKTLHSTVLHVGSILGLTANLCSRPSQQRVQYYAWFSEHVSTMGPAVRDLIYVLATHTGSSDVSSYFERKQRQQQ